MPTPELTVRHVMQPDPVSVEPGRTLRDALELMNRHRIGAIIVCDAAGALAGIFTERDLLRRVVALGLDPADTPVELVMTSPVVVGTPSTPLDECASVMTSRRLRHLPIVDGDQLVGMVTIGDVLAQRMVEQEVTIAELNRYVFDTR